MHDCLFQTMANEPRDFERMWQLMPHLRRVAIGQGTRGYREPPGGTRVNGWSAFEQRQQQRQCGMHCWLGAPALQALCRLPALRYLKVGPGRMFYALPSACLLTA